MQSRVLPFSYPQLPDTTSHVNQNDVKEEFIAGDDVDNKSLSSDKTWTPSVEGKDLMKTNTLMMMGPFGKRLPYNIKISPFPSIRLTITWNTDILKK